MTFISSPTSSASSSTTATTASAPLTKIGADFNLFLKMLTSQVQNQDPLDPLDASEYTKQLIQFSQVEQSIQQTATLKDIMAGQSQQTMAQAASFIGLEGRFSTQTAGYDASTGIASWGYTAERSAARMLATITDSSGKTVQTIDLGKTASIGRLNWDGKTLDGTQAPSGPYSLSISAMDAAGNAVPVQVNALGTVRSIASDGGQVVISAGGVNLPISSLIAVSAAQSAI